MVRQYAPALKLLDGLTDDGMIDLDKMYPALKDAVHKAFIDTVSGLIVMNYATEDADFTRLLVIVPGLTSYSSYDNYKESYWNDGKTRAISFTITVEEVATDYTIFVNNNHVYFNVSFKDAATAGNDVAADACYQSTALYVYIFCKHLIYKRYYETDCKYHHGQHFRLACS